MSLDYVALILLDRKGIGAAASRMEDEATVQSDAFDSRHARSRRLQRRDRSTSSRRRGVNGRRFSPSKQVSIRPNSTSAEPTIAIK
jgi:hypothetical protein